MSVKQYQFELLENCSGNIKEDYGDEEKTSAVAEYSRCNVKAISWILRINWRSQSEEKM